ncbi:MAG TPA: restriction endonuclease subunit S, partial [Bacteroidetes bacterium]|nr:restriction endonuclease subunit S [Bacteroidota bacterium]
DIAELSNDIWKVGEEDSIYIGLEHIEEGKLRLNGFGYSKDVASNKIRFTQNQFLFGKLRPYFRKVVKPNFSGICSTDIWAINPKDGTDLSFLFYLFANKEFVDIAYKGSSGTRMPRADWNFMKSTKWLIPKDINEQKAIAAVLSSLDDKIDLLQRQNKTMEALAETLFRQWFIEPARAGKPHAGGEAQDDWEQISLFDAIELVGGGTPKTSISEYWNGNINWLSGGDISANHKGIIVDTEKTITALGLKNSSTKILPKFSTVISARGTVGKYCILSKPMAFSQSNYGIRPKFSNCYFFTYLLIAYSVDELQSAAYGSVFDTITTNTFKGHLVLLPKPKIIEAFEDEIKPIFEKMLNNQIQIRTLEKLRDTLLPKLMSGEVRVADPRA